MFQCLLTTFSKCHHYCNISILYSTWWPLFFSILLIDNQSQPLLSRITSYHDHNSIVHRQTLWWWFKFPHFCKLNITNYRMRFDISCIKHSRPPPSLPTRVLILYPAPGGPAPRPRPRPLFRLVYSRCRQLESNGHNVTYILVVTNCIHRNISTVSHHQFPSYPAVMIKMSKHVPKISWTFHQLHKMGLNILSLTLETEQLCINSFKGKIGKIQHQLNIYKLKDRKK